MASEKSMILKMVDEGKISVDDAIKLLDAVKYDDNQVCDKQNFFEAVDLEDKINRFSRSAENFAKDAGSWMSQTWKGVEPKVKSGAKVAIEKTISAIDKLSNSLSEGLKSLEDSVAQDNCTECQEPTATDANTPDDIPREN